MIETATGLLMLIGGLGAIIQNYSRWQKYHDKEDLYWVYAGAFAVLTALYFFSTRYLIPITTDNVMFLTWSRRILLAFGFLGWIVLGFRAYVMRIGN
jgi:hypothetical protein